MRCCTCSRSRMPPGVPLELDDFERIRERTPVFCELKPSGRYVADRPASRRRHPAGDEDAARGGLAPRRLHDGHGPDHRREPRRTCRASLRRARTSSGLSRIRCIVRATWRFSAATSRPKAAWPRSAASRWIASPAPRASSTAKRTCMAAIMGDKIHAGDVVVIRYEGPKGGPGMREMLSPTCGHHRQRPRRQSRLHHRRTFLGRDLRHGRRSRGAGSAGRRPYRAHPRRRHDHHRCRDALARGERSMRPRWSDAVPRGRRRRPATPPVCSPSTRGSSRAPLSAR